MFCINKYQHESKDQIHLNILVAKVRKYRLQIHIYVSYCIGTDQQIELIPGVSNKIIGFSA